MCNKHSFVMDRDGHVYSAAGVSDSHSEICQIWQLDQDKVNAYEWRPPEVWPSDDWTQGFVRDRLSFEEKASHVAALERYLREHFPTKEAWDDYRNYNLHGHRYTANGQTIVIACKRELLIATEGHVEAYGSATVRAYGSATVRAYGSATVRAYGSATVEAYGSATVRAYGSATVKAYGSATVRASDSATVEASDSATVEAYDSATVEAYDSATVEAYDSATVEASDSATVEAYDSATVEAYDSATVRAYGSATVEAYDSATVIKPYSTWRGSVTVQLAGLAVLIDRSEDGKVVVSRASEDAPEPKREVS